MPTSVGVLTGAQEVIQFWAPGLDQCQWDHFHILLPVPSLRRQHMDWSFYSHKQFLLHTTWMSFWLQKELWKDRKGVISICWFNLQHKCKVDESLVQRNAVLDLKLNTFVSPSESTSPVTKWEGRSKSWESKGPQLHLGRKTYSQSFVPVYPSFSWPCLLPRQELLICCSFQQWT